MGFVERALTPPGTGGREAAQIQANTDIAAAKAKGRSCTAESCLRSQLPLLRLLAFSPGQSPGAKQAARTTATSMLWRSGYRRTVN